MKTDSADSALCDVHAPGGKPDPISKDAAKDAVAANYENMGGPLSKGKPFAGLRGRQEEVGVDVNGEPGLRQSPITLPILPTKI